MRIGTFEAHIIEACAQRNISYYEAARLAVSYGIENICVFTDQTKDIDEKKKTVNDSGLHITDVCGNINFITGKDIAGESEKLIEQALRLGAERLQITTDAFTDPENAELRKKDDFMVAEGLALCAEKAESSGLKIVVEDYDANNGPLTCTADIKYVLDNAPGVFFAFDSGNFVHAGEDELAALKLMKDKLAHAHFKDRTLKKHREDEIIGYRYKNLQGKAFFPCPVGSGIIGFDEIKKVFTEVNYDGMILLEHFDAPDQLSYLEKSAEFVKKLFRI